MGRRLHHPARMQVAHDVERGKQRIVRFPGSESEGIEDDRRHTPHARIAIDNLTEVVRAGMSDGCFGVGNQGFQTLPAHRALNGNDLVLAFRLRREHGFGHAEQGSRRCFEHLGPVDDLILMGSIGETG